MTTTRANVISLCALMLAAAAFFNSLWPATPTARGAPGQQAAPAAQVNAAAATASGERIFNYQGILRNPAGELTDGAFAITFSLYNEVEGGSPLYTETQPNVVVRNGLFNVLLGDQGSPIGTDVIAINPLFLGITIGADAEMRPRQRIHAVPAASTLVPGASIGGDLTVQGALNVGNPLLVGPAGRQIELNSLVNEWTEIRTLNQDLRLNTIGHHLYLNPWQDSGNVYVGNGGNILDVNGLFYINGNPPIVIRRYLNQGDEADVYIQYENGIGINTSTHKCVVAGWNARYDINESSAGNNFVWTYTDADGWWRLHVAFYSQDTQESPDADVLCFSNALILYQGDSASNEANSQ